MTTQTEAERLAKALEWPFSGLDTQQKAAAELRRLVSFNQQLMDEVARLNKAVADEREACAELCSDIDGGENMFSRAIRARGNT